MAMIGFLPAVLMTVKYLIHEDISMCIQDDENNVWL